MNHIKFMLYTIAAGLLAGTLSAFFLVSLEWVTSMQNTYHWLLWLLPLGGALVSYAYIKFGKDTSRGNALIFEQIQTGRGSVPFRIVPFVLGGTLITHLFGGSAGREGTAMQMGGGAASWLGAVGNLNAEQIRLLLLAGISAGFGSLFGTPLAAAVFALEAAARGKQRLHAIIPCLAASYTAHFVCLLWGAKHQHYFISLVPHFNFIILIKLIAASAAIGAAAWLFKKALSSLKRLFQAYLPHTAWRSFAGGIIIIALVYALGTRAYLGLGLPLIEQAFDQPAAAQWFALKLIFTVITLAAGFIGGEVTPLFAIGATLGSALAPLIGTSPSFLAAIGLSAMFGAATKAPLAAFVLGLELFGTDAALYLLAACLISSLCSGKNSIYAAPVRQSM
ncbi:MULTISPECIES: chloride channel protein [unclassified Paenibacillus]|uniref:chloride channel protein n=1 Tax=unclassified Paenibacillus TaxID=185978 RepID=UPI002F42F28D